MSHYLIQQIRAIDNIVVRPRTQVVALHGEDSLERISVADASTGTTDDLTASYVFVFIGAAPRTEWLEGVVARDKRGFICTGPDLVVDGARPKGWPLDRDPFYLETSVPGVFVAGDVRAESVKRVASAVGEGAMAVTLVHRYIDKVTT
jgi:thioredoxin reductase (NADPH)